VALVHEARERLRTGSRRLMAAMVHRSRAELTACLADPVPVHREVAAIELAKLLAEDAPN